MQDKIAIVILARGQYCKRISHKPLALLGGRHLIEYTLDICKQLPYETYVYTDMQEIKDVAKDFHVRDKLFESEEGIHHTGKELAVYNKEIQADIIILLQVTSPLRDIEKVQQWIRSFLLSDVDCGIAAKKQEGFFYNVNGTNINFLSFYRKYNEKDSSRYPLYKETGAFYIFRKEQISKNHITNGRVLIFDDPYDIDINTLEDLKRAEALCKQE